MNYESEIFNVSNDFWEEIFTDFDGIAAQLQFKSVVLGMQDIK